MFEFVTVPRVERQKRARVMLKGYFKARETV